MLLITFLLSLIFIGTLSKTPNDLVGGSILYLQKLPLLSDLAAAYGLGHTGIALSASIASTFGFLLVAILLKRDGILVPWPKIWSGLARILFASVTAGYLAFTLAALVSTNSFVITFFGGTIFLALFLGFARILNIPELDETYKLIRRLLNRTR